MHSVSKYMRLSEPTTKIWTKIDPHYQRRRCSPMTPVSGSTRFMRIFAGIPWRWRVKQQWGNRKRLFSGLSDATSSAPYRNEANIIIQHYFVPCRVSTDPEIHDLEWLWNLEWLFYVKFLQGASIACYAEPCISYDGVVCPSVRLSVTRWHWVKTTQARITKCSLTDSSRILVLAIKSSSRYFLRARGR